MYLSLGLCVYEPDSSTCPFTGNLSGCTHDWPVDVVSIVRERGVRWEGVCFSIMYSPDVDWISRQASCAVTSLANSSVSNMLPVLESSNGLSGLS